jgi:hypothetical protein
VSLSSLSCDLSRIFRTEGAPPPCPAQRGPNHFRKLSGLTLHPEHFAGLSLPEPGPEPEPQLGLPAEPSQAPAPQVQTAPAPVAALASEPVAVGLVTASMQATVPEQDALADPEEETAPAVEPHLLAGVQVKADAAVDSVEAETVHDKPRFSPDWGLTTQGHSFAATSRDLVAIMTLPSGQAQPQERLFAGDALVAILPHLDSAQLINLTRTVARLDLVSERLRSYLVCHRDNDISCRMLKDSVQISDVDLLALIPRASEQQLRLIARRRMLSMTVSDLLIRTGNRASVLDLLRNADCQLSHWAFEALPAIVKDADDLTSAMCNRQDLPQAVGIKLFWQANGNLRRYLLSRFLTESAALGRVIDVSIAAGAIPPLGGQPKAADVQQLVTQIETGHPDAAITLAICCHLSPETARLIVADAGGEPLAVAFKALAQTRLCMAEALKRWIASPACAINGHNRIIELHALFDSLSFNKARMLLAYWDWASRDAGPFTPLHG